MYCSMPQGGVERPDIEKIEPSNYHVRQVRNMQTAPSVDPCRRRSKGNRKKRHRCVRAPTANSSAPHAQQTPKPVVLVLRCRAEMVMIVEVNAWSRRPAPRTGAAGAPTRKETPGPYSACVVRSTRRRVHLRRRRAGDRPAMRRCHSTVRHIHRRSRVYASGAAKRRCAAKLAAFTKTKRNSKLRKFCVCTKE